MSIAVFQVLLSLGLPFGEYAMGGSYKILPKRLRIVSVVNALILLLMGFVCLQHTHTLIDIDLPTSSFIWFISILLGINTIANLLSRSKKERLVMTPLSGLTFLLCLIIALL
ncbi:hypothetical protein [Lysinibacillus endophyticus]|uniref:hypothetical protein n=1 Tax=Ureibacillus endophyticus TaxID=1978490 RepID=UPI00209F5E60|nr:hypothetical protein [Lysinibacillus endophyticus]